VVLVVNSALKNIDIPQAGLEKRTGHRMHKNLFVFN